MPIKQFPCKLLLEWFVFLHKGLSFSIMHQLLWKLIMDIAKVINPNYHPLFRTLLDSLHHSVKINSICAKIGSCNQVDIKPKASCIQHSNFLMFAIMGLWCISAWTMTNDTCWWQSCAISPSLHSLDSHSACRCVTSHWIFAFVYCTEPSIAAQLLQTIWPETMWKLATSSSPSWVLF